MFAAGVAAGLAGAGAVFAATGFGAGGVDVSPAFFFGGKMVRAEVLVKAGGLTHDFRLDRGSVRATSGSSITLRERTGEQRTFPVAAGADIRLNGRPVTLAQLRRGVNALVIRDGDAPAGWIRASTALGGG